MKENGVPKIVWLCMLTTAFFFSTMEIALKSAGSQFDVLQLTFLRFFIGGLILLPFGIKSLKKRGVKLIASDYFYLLILGIVCICISMCLFQIGVMTTNANLAAVIIAVNPVFTMIFAHFMTDDKFSFKKFIVLLMSVIGLVIFANPFNLGDGNSTTGLLCVLVASVAFGLYTVIGKKRIAKIGGMAQNALSFILGSLVLLVIILATGRPVVAGITIDNLWLVMYVSVFVTGVGYYCFGKALELSNPSTASIAFFIKPVLAMILSYIILKEAITINMLIGVMLILIGSGINIFWKK